MLQAKQPSTPLRCPHDECPKEGCLNRPDIWPGPQKIISKPPNPTVEVQLTEDDVTRLLTWIKLIEVIHPHWVRPSDHELKDHLREYLLEEYWP